MEHVFDIVIVGAGISGSTLCSDLADRIAFTDGTPPTVCLLDDAPRPGGGCAYGASADDLSMIVCDLGRFIDGPIRNDFVNWLNAYAAQVLRNEQTSAVSRWLHKIGADIPGFDWLSTQVPRRFFGMFLEERLSRSIQRARDRHPHAIRQESCRATRVSPDQDGYCIELQDGSVIRASQVVLAIGAGRLPIIAPSGKASTGMLFIPSIYSPSLGETRRTIAEASRHGRKRMIIIGSNASALDLLHSLYSDETSRETMASVVVASPTGRFPGDERQPAIVPDRSEGPPLHSTEFDPLVSIFESFMDDLRDAANEPIMHAAPKVVEKLNRRLDALALADQNRYLATYARRTVSALRRAASEHLNAVNFYAGRTTFIQSHYDDESMAFMDDSGRVIIQPGQGDIVVDCRGGAYPRPVDGCYPSLGELDVSTVLCRTNEAGLGILVDEQLQVSEGLYVLGPLLAGLITPKRRSWHIEDASLCFQMATDLAMRLWAKTLLTEPA